MKVAADEFKLILEPSGAVALAGALSDHVDKYNRTVIVIASGGNIEPEAYARLIGGK